MKELPLFVTFYTDDYAIAAGNLTRSLKRHHLEYKAVRVEDRGSWQANCHIKPHFLWDCITQSAGRPVIWVDADAEIVASPTLLIDGKFSGDVGVCRWARPNSRLETLSGTVFFKGSQNSIRVVDRWIEACEENPNHWDQTCLQMAIERVPEAIVELLPLEYCWIYDTFREIYPTRHPIIEHYQLSRKTRIRLPARKK